MSPKSPMMVQLCRRFIIQPVSVSSPVAVALLRCGLRGADLLYVGGGGGRGVARGGEGAQWGGGGLQLVVVMVMMIGILAVVEARLVAEDNAQGWRGGAAEVRVSPASLLPLAVLEQGHLCGRRGGRSLELANLLRLGASCCSGWTSTLTSRLQQRGDTAGCPASLVIHSSCIERLLSAHAPRHLQYSPEITIPPTEPTCCTVSTFTFLQHSLHVIICQHFTSSTCVW